MNVQNLEFDAGNREDFCLQFDYKSTQNTRVLVRGYMETKQRWNRISLTATPDNYSTKKVDLKIPIEGEGKNYTVSY